MRSAKLLLVASLSLSACSLSLEPDELDPLETAEGFCQALLGEAYSFMDRCGTLAGSPEAEYARTLPFCSALARSRTVYDRAAGEACLARIDAASCSVDVQDLLEGCEAFRGTVTVGGACSDAIECADPFAECASPYGTCPGTCMLRGELDDPCGGGYPPCDEGLYCPGSTCQAFVVPDPSYYCESDYECGPPELVYCGGDTSCHGRPSEGAACSVSAQDCEIRSDDEELFCRATIAGDVGSCERIGTLPVGASCGATRWCQPTAYCASGACAQRLGAGATCVGDQCAAPLTCVADRPGLTMGTCGAKLAVGAACQVGSRDCVLGAFCAGPANGTGACRSWPSQAGEPCGNVNGEEVHCGQGWCGWVAAPVSAYQCRPFLAVGADCSTTVAGSRFPIEDNDPCGKSGLVEDARCASTTSGERCVASCMR